MSQFEELEKQVKSGELTPKNLKKLPSFVETKVSKGAGFEDLFKSFKFQNSTYWSSWVDLIGKKNKWVSFTSKELNMDKETKVKEIISKYK